MTFKRGDSMYWKKSGWSAWEKLDDNDFGWWVSLDSTFPVRKETVNPATGQTEVDHEAHWETEKPLYKKNDKGEDTELNRFGFRWTDNQVYEYYKGIMKFVTYVVDDPYGWDLLPERNTAVLQSNK